MPTIRHPAIKVEALKTGKLPANKTILPNPQAFELVAKYCEETWRFKDRWAWADIANDETPQDIAPPH